MQPSKSSSDFDFESLDPLLSRPNPVPDEEGRVGADGESQFGDASSQYYDHYNHGQSSVFGAIGSLHHHSSTISLDQSGHIGTLNMAWHRRLAPHLQSMPTIPSSGGMYDVHSRITSTQTTRGKGVIKQHLKGNSVVGSEYGGYSKDIASLNTPIEPIKQKKIFGTNNNLNALHEKMRMKFPPNNLSTQSSCSSAEGTRPRDMGCYFKQGWSLSKGWSNRPQPKAVNHNNLSEDIAHFAERNARCRDMRDHICKKESHDFGFTYRSDPTAWKFNIVVSPNATHTGSRKAMIIGAAGDGVPGPKYR